VFAGEEALTIFVDKRKLSKKADVSEYSGSGNSSSVTLEALHQLAASYFIDRESTLRKLHHIQIASTAIKVHTHTHTSTHLTHTHTHTHNNTQTHPHTYTNTHAHVHTLTFHQT
jgi:hypothetical protein